MHYVDLRTCLLLQPYQFLSSPAVGRAMPAQRHVGPSNQMNLLYLRQVQSKATLVSRSKSIHLSSMSSSSVINPVPISGLLSLCHQHQNVAMLLRSVADVEQLSSMLFIAHPLSGAICHGHELPTHVHCGPFSCETKRQTMHNGSSASYERSTLFASRNHQPQSK